jgi:hypothetical protein
MTSAWSCRQEEASGQQIEPCPAKHLALQHLQTIDLAFDRSLTPRQCHRCLDGGHVRPEPLRKAPQGREGALGGGSQPWVERCRLAPADQPGKVLRERHSFRQRGRLLGEPRQQVVVLLRALFRRAEDQPGRAARGERAWWSRRHCREG